MAREVVVQWNGKRPGRSSLQYELTDNLLVRLLRRVGRQEVHAMVEDAGVLPGRTATRGDPPVHARLVKLAPTVQLLRIGPQKYQHLGTLEHTNMVELRSDLGLPTSRRVE